MVNKEDTEDDSPKKLIFARDYTFFLAEVAVMFLVLMYWCFPFWLDLILDKRRLEKLCFA